MKDPGGIILLLLHPISEGDSPLTHHLNSTSQQGGDSAAPEDTYTRKQHRSLRRARDASRATAAVAAEAPDPPNTEVASVGCECRQKNVPACFAMAATLGGPPSLGRAAHVCAGPNAYFVKVISCMWYSPVISRIAG